MNINNEVEWQNRKDKLGIAMTYDQKAKQFIVYGKQPFFNGMRFISSRLGRRNKKMIENEKDGSLKLIWKVKCNQKNADLLRSLIADAFMHAHLSLMDLDAVMSSDKIPDINFRLTYTPYDMEQIA